MHFTTRCPACGTMFRVVKDQLKLSDGWVRCGDCSHVFDATLQLRMEEVVRMPDALPPASTPLASPRHQPVTQAPQRSESASAHPADTGRPAGEVLVAEPVQSQSGITQVPEPGFVRQARRRAFWRSPGVRALLVLSSFLLSLLLLVQWVFHHRDQLVVSEPALAPWLVRACETLGCELAPVRRLEAIVIDSTALVRRLDQFYGFDIVLKNTASIPIAMPALELTLTRLDDTVLARRVFLAEELPGAPPLLPASSSVAMGLRLSLAEGQSMAGYRALVFYP